MSFLRQRDGSFVSRCVAVCIEQVFALGDCNADCDVSGTVAHAPKHSDEGIYSHDKAYRFGRNAYLSKENA